MVDRGKKPSNGVSERVHDFATRFAGLCSRRFYWGPTPITRTVLSFVTRSELTACNQRCNKTMLRRPATWWDILAISGWVRQLKTTAVR